MRIWPRHTVNITSKVFSIVFNAFIHRHIIEGSDVAEFEKSFAEYHGIDYAAGVASARSGLCLALQALNFTAGDEIIVSAFNYAPMAALIIALRLKPVFVDIEEHTFNINTKLIEQHITYKTKAILVTHAFGLPCEMDEIMAIAQKYHLRVIEDCAHACGAKFNDKLIGTFGDIGIFSFAMGKNIPCFGGGMVLCKGSEVNDALREQLSHYAAPTPLELLNIFSKHLFCFTLTHPTIFPILTYPLLRVLNVMGVSLSSHKEDLRSIRVMCCKAYQKKISNMQAAVGVYQLKRLDAINNKLRENALFYNETVEQRDGFTIQHDEKRDRKYGYLYYCFLVEKSLLFQKKMLKKGIDIERNHLSNCATFPLFDMQENDFPATKKAAAHSVDLPNNQYLTHDDMTYIVDCAEEILKSYD